MYDLIIHNARVHGMTEGSGIAQTATSLAIKDGRIAALDVAASSDSAEHVDARDAVILPGFIDCHTHAVFAGNRMHEHSLKLGGASYEEIARAGGGIASTVAAVQAADAKTLAAESLPRLDALLREGVTTIEIKSGYGLATEHELKMLEAVELLRGKTPQLLVSTFLGAHAIPKDRNKQDYLDEVINDMLPLVAERQLAEAVDIFVENIAFDRADLERLFDAAQKLGFKLKAHTDQLSNMGGTAAAASYKALSCEHLEYTDLADIKAMAAAGSVAVLLPGAFYFLKETRKPPIEGFREAGVPFAVATDLNPGSSPVASLLTAMHMSAILFGLTVEEALLGVTRNAARALGRDDIGSLDIGMRADLTLWNIGQPEFLLYQLGGLTPTRIYIEGQEQ
ncbi:MAG: imidazolonepropionase [Gammaproteobacteria bacterium]|nr:imidazolonepropionase [Gammaproteobacteria bacterium]